MRRVLFSYATLVFLLVASGCGSGSDGGGPRFPFDHQHIENSALEREYQEGKAQLEQIREDPCLEDILAGVPKEYQRCGDGVSQSSSGTSNDDYDFDNSFSSTSIRGCVNVSSLNVRSGPGTNYSAVGYLSDGDCVNLNERNGDSSWAKFREGWISTYYLDIQGSISELPVASNIPEPSVNNSGGNTSSGSTCVCSYNAYNCKDFSTQMAAQKCYNYCLSKVGYDVHWLDDDDDGRACELNP